MACLSRFFFRVVFILGLSLCCAVSVSAEEFTPAQRQLLDRVERYLNQMTTFRTSFKQYSQDGQLATGTFYLSRPGKIRWEYTEPNPLLIVGKGKLLAYFDIELDEISFISLEDVAAGLLTKQQIDLDKDVVVKAIAQEDGLIYLTVEDKSKEREGQLTLIFDSKNLVLTGMQLLDSVNVRTVIYFEKMQERIPLDAQLFKYPEEKSKSQRRQ